VADSHLYDGLKVHPLRTDALETIAFCPFLPFVAFAMKKASKKTPKKKISRVAVAEAWFRIEHSKIQGRGGFALRSIPKGTKIVEYIGERISHAEASRRYDDGAMRRHHTFLFEVSKRTCIDGAKGGNEARYFNHSCAPNCEALQEGLRIFIHARRRILQGEELTYDYAYNDTGESPSHYACRCGAKRCRGTIVAP
jgi:uncharacterized protein